MNRDLVTDLLDTLGLLLIAAGVAGAAWSYIDWAGLILGGAVVLAGSWLTSWLSRPRRRKG